MKTGFEAAEVLLKTDDDRPWLDTQRQPPRVRAMLIYRRHRRQANLLPLVFVAPPRIYIYIYIYISADESSLLKLTAGQAHTSALLKAINSGEKAHCAARWREAGWRGMWCAGRVLVAEHRGAWDAVRQWLAPCMTAVLRCEMCAMCEGAVY